MQKIIYLISFYIKICAVSLYMIALPAVIFSQNKTIDSLNNIVKTASDSVKSLALIDLASNYYGYDTIKCDRSLQNAATILSGKPWTYNLAYYYEVNSDIQTERGKYERSLLFDDSAIFFYKIAIQSSNLNTRKATRFQMAVVTADKGSTYSTLGRNDKAMQYFLEALKLYEQSDNLQRDKKIGTCYNNIATVYYTIGDYNKSLEYDVKAIPFHLRGADNETISFAYIFAASDFLMIKQVDSAKAYFLQASPYVTALNKPSLNIEYYGKTGMLFWTIKDWPNAIKYYKIAYDNTVAINDVAGQPNYLRGIADASYFAGMTAQAEQFGLRALTIIEENNFITEKIQIYNLLSLIYAQKGDYKNAYNYSKKYVGITIKTNQEELKKKVNELDMKYHSEKKEKEIIQLQKDKQIQNFYIKQKSTLNYFLFGSVAVLLIFGFLGYRNFRHRQQLAKQQDELRQQQIRELEKDKQLVAVDSMLKGQEDERSRLAKDLHDGLGGLLSGVKFSLSNMKDNLIITPDNMTVFERSLDMIDTSITELRRVAHNMMPEMLVKFGLDEALKEYCNSINTTKLLTVKYQSLGMEEHMDKSIEIIIYRIIQELLNNIMKHAGATKAFVQLIKESARLSVVVEDNGKGFDTSIAGNNKGAGLENVRSRVNYLKGQLDIHGEPGKGTLVNIEFNV